MFKFLLSIFTVLAISPLCGGCCDPIDVRVSAFFPTGKLFREIYDKCLVNYEIEAGKNLGYDYQLWGNVGWIYKTGHSTFSHTKTKFQNVNVSAGVKHIFNYRDYLKFYAGLGINVAVVHIHNYSPYVEPIVRKGGVGGVVKAGLYFEPADNYFFELFTDYLYQEMHFESHVQIGGVKVGGGFGVKF